MVSAAELANVVAGRCSHVPRRRFRAILSGAFNPLHDGHRAMRGDAAGRLGHAVAYELCVVNVDKPPLDYHDLNRRLEQFRAGEVVITNTPTFIAKARALGGITFVVGADTLARIAEPGYYGGGAARDAAVAEMAAMGCAFLVYGRLGGGVFSTLADMALPPTLAAICTGVAESEFRSDLSSTALRRSPGD